MNIDIEHLAKLARIRLSDSEKVVFGEDLNKIISHFKELETLSTDDVVPMTGGTNLKNVFREDFSISQSDAANLNKALPETKNGLLRVPEIFE